MLKQHFNSRGLLSELYAIPRYECNRDSLTFSLTSVKCIAAQLQNNEVDILVL